MRVYFDASVIIAALLSPTGGSALLFQFIKAGRLVGVTSQTVIEEVLEEDKPKKLNKNQRRDRTIYRGEQFGGKRNNHFTGN